MIDILSILLILGWLFVPAFILTYYTGKDVYTFLGYMAIFMFVGALSGDYDYNILPSYFVYLSIVIGAIYLYKAVIKNE